MYKYLAKVCHVCGVTWMTLFVISVIGGIIGMFLSEPSFMNGLRRVQDTFSPFNIWNSIVMLAVALPGIGLFHLRDKFRRKSLETQ